MKRQDIRIRDPYIVAHEGVYYLYASSGTSVSAEEEAAGAGKMELWVYTSTDLENWSEPKIVFSCLPTEGSVFVRDLWAPEVHVYAGKFYAFMSFLNRTGKRGTYVAVSDTPDGTFTLLSDLPVTPVEQSCIDGSLYIEDGVPYVVYSHDWPDTYVPEKDVYIGSICARRLTDDLKEGTGDAMLLFRSSDVKLSAEAPNCGVMGNKKITRYGSDAPFICTLSDGKLMLTWSPMLDKNYVVLAAISDSGKIAGPWRHIETPVYDNNGGHAMFFQDFEGKTRMCIHQPEAWYQERLLCLEMEEKDGFLKVEEK